MVMSQKPVAKKHRFFSGFVAVYPLINMGL